jgi:superfamily II helicase
MAQLKQRTLCKQRIFIHKNGDEFEIKIDHCTPSSCVEIEALCDYCLKQDKITVIKRKYRNYYKDQINGIIHTDACLNCASKKAKDIVNKKQELGLLTKKDSHYWFFYENRLHELKNIILDKRDLSEVLRKKQVLD